MLSRHLAPKLKLAFSSFHTRRVNQIHPRLIHTTCTTASAPLPLSDAQRCTIYAVATPPGKGGIAVIRISGPEAIEVYRRMVRPVPSRKGREKNERDGRRALVPLKMQRCSVIDPLVEDVLDDGLMVFFKSPHSFTTEDVLELHVHSGRAILSSILAALSSIPGLRPAERGEFTRRAFIGGRMDLTQVEGLRDLIDAETAGQRRMAASAMRGSIKKRFEEIRNAIVSCMSMIEALIDFGEGEGIEEGVYDTARARVLSLHETIASHLSDNRRGEILRSGVRLTIFGPPNAGKSSLLNFLAQRDAAIVTPVPGTTRDVLELTLDIDGLAVVVADTAGLRKTRNIVERIGVERARERVNAADVSLCVLSIPELVSFAGEVRVPEAVSALITPATFIVLNKSDLSPASDVTVALKAMADCSATVWAASLSTGAGAGELLKGLGQALSARYALVEGSPEPLITNARHRIHLESAQRFLEAFLETDDIVLAAEELRYAADAVGKVTGVIGVEEVLDGVFREFCIGK